MCKINLLLQTNDIVQFTSTTNFKFSNLEELFFSSYTPGVKIIDKLPHSPNFTIEYIESTQPHIVRTSKGLRIFDNWGDKLSFDLYHLIYGVCRLLYLDKQLYSVHSSCIDNKGLVLIVGHSGSGKTSVALDMMLRHKAKWASGNRTLLAFDKNSKMKALAGTPTVTIKEKDKQKFRGLYEIAYPYFDRLAFELIGDVSYSFTEESFLKAIVITSPLSTTNEFKIVDVLGALHALYPLFLDVVNSDVVLCNGKEVFDGSAPIEIKKYLSNNLSNALEDLPVYSIKGSVDFVVSKVSEI